jgi:hypothetical protein
MESKSPVRTPADSNVDACRCRAASTQQGISDELAPHPAIKPAQMTADAIEDVSPRGARILDLFRRRGPTLVAAHQTGPPAFGSESHLHCERILRRCQSYAQHAPERLACGLPTASNEAWAT